MGCGVAVGWQAISSKPANASAIGLVTCLSFDIVYSFLAVKGIAYHAVFYHLDETTGQFLTFDRTSWPSHSVPSSLLKTSMFLALLCEI